MVCDFVGELHLTCISFETIYLSLWATFEANIRLYNEFTLKFATFCQNFALHSFSISRNFICKKGFVLWDNNVGQGGP